MATGNLFLGDASRSVGDVTMYVRNGKQVSRVRRRTVSNPRSGLQLAQRCVLKTVSTAYSILAPICCQSFQGKQSRSMNQARFQKLNLDMLRAKAAAAVDGEGMTEAGIYDNTTGNFVGKQTLGAVVNPYIISEGSLHFNGFSVDESNSLAAATYIAIADITYQQFINAIGAQPGDQLTFCVLFTDMTEVGVGSFDYPNAGLITDFQYARIVLAPGSGDLGVKMFSSAGAGKFLINDPNPRNEGSLSFAVTGDPQKNIVLASINGRTWEAALGESNVVAAAAVILSRQTNSGWQYSHADLELLYYDLDGDGSGLDLQFPLNAAVASFEASQDSSKYLDQARRVV